jgi:hypothetical protein
MPYLGVRIVTLYLFFLVEGLIAYIAKTKNIELGHMGITGLIFRIAPLVAAPAVVVRAVVATHLITIILAVIIFKIISLTGDVTDGNCLRAGTDAPN